MILVNNLSDRTASCSVPNGLFSEKARKHAGFGADMEQRNNFFFIEQINSVFDRKQMCAAHVYTRVKDFLCRCFIVEDI